MKNNNKVNGKFFVGRQIRASQVLLINDQNENLGVVGLDIALQKAYDVGLDLVQVSFDNNKPTCKIIDFGKFKYEQSKKEKLAKKKQREGEIRIKEIKFRPTTDLNDLKIKAKKAKDFLLDGDKVKVTIVFRGRELSHKEVADDTLKSFLSFLPEADIISEPLLNGKNLSVTVGLK